MVINSKKTSIKSKSKVDLKFSGQNKFLQDEINEIKNLIGENLRYTKQNSQSSNLEAQKELRKLLQENLEISKELQEMTKKINRWVVWQRFWSVLKILIIVIPIVIGVLYLPPLVHKMVEPYQQLLNFGKDSSDQNLVDQIKSLINLDANKQIPEQFIEQLPE